MERYLNREFVEASRLENHASPKPAQRLRRMIERHVELTGSEWGARVLERWEMMLGYWVYVVPKNMAASDAISQQDVPLRVVRA